MSNITQSNEAVNAYSGTCQVCECESDDLIEDWHQAMNYAQNGQCYSQLRCADLLACQARSVALHMQRVEEGRRRWRESVEVAS